MFNMKKKPVEAVVLLIASLFISGCSSVSVSTENSSSDTGSADSKSSSSSSSEPVEKEEDTYDSYYESASEYSSDSSTSNLNLTNIQGGYESVIMPSTGDSKLLVIPVEFSDYSFDDNYKTLLENAFFGEAEDTSWESVTSYYYKSSNGKLNIQGTVADKVSLNMTLSSTFKWVDATDVVDRILVTALNELAETMDLTEYDSNDDGYIDAVWFVNSGPASYDYDITWAFTYWYFEDTTFDECMISSYSWGSIDFLKEWIDEDKAENYNADTHTLIHETGHLLGLEDYYSYDSGEDNPVGCLDMMDYNVGDNMEFSKYLLGWVEPTVLTEDYLKEVDYTIDVNTSSIGENTCYILPIQSENCAEDFNYTPYDEYLIIEYYTPTGLDEEDANNPYDGYLGNYTESGVMVYHVNARLGKIRFGIKGWTWDGYIYDEVPVYTEDSDWGYLYYYLPIYSNTASYCYDTNFADSTKDYYQGRLVSLLPQTGHKATDSNWGLNDFLYQEGDKFMLDGTYQDFVFEDGRAPLFGFEVSSIDSTKATLTFSRN